MENWEVELVKALKDAENKREDSDHVVAKWRLIDQALRPHRHWILWRIAAAAVIILVSVVGVLFRTLPVEEGKTVHPIANMEPQAIYRVQPVIPSLKGQVKPMLKNRGRHIRTKAAPGPRVERNTAIEVTSVSDTSVSPVSSGPLIAIVSESTRRRPIRRTGSSLYIENDDTVRRTIQETRSKPALAKRKQGVRSGWVTQIRF